MQSNPYGWRLWMLQKSTPRFLRVIFFRTAVFLALFIVGVMLGGGVERAYGWQVDSGAYWNSTSQTLTGGWTSVGSTSQPLDDAQMAVIGDYVYQFGGFSGTSYVNTIYRAPVSNPTTWTNTGATLPGNLGNSQLAIIGGYVYLFGGNRLQGGSEIVEDVIYRAPVSDPTAWVDTGAVLPDELMSSELAIIGNYVYLFGGWLDYSGGFKVRSNRIYRASLSDPLTWTNTGATLPTALDDSELTVAGSYIYLLGGYRDGSSPGNTIYRAPTSNPLSWTNTGSSLPASYVNANSVVLGSNVYLFGGFFQANSISAPASNAVSWSNSGTAMPSTSGTCCVTAIGDYLYAFVNSGGSITIYRAPLTPGNTGPVTPTITGTTTGYANIAYTFTLSGATDPQGNTIRYGVDWDNNSTVDEYVPASGYVSSGASQDVNHSWSTSGAKTFQARAEDSLGATSSGWDQHTITIEAAPTALITASTTSFRQGDAAVGITWSSSGATSCTGTNFSTGGATSGWTTVTPTATTTYAVNCTGPGGSGSDNETINYAANQAPTAPSITGPTAGRTGTTYQYTITGTDSEGDLIQNGIDCNNDGVVETWGATTTSGTPQILSCSWSSAGTYSVRGVTLDSRGALSNFSTTPVSIIIAPACTDCYPLMGYGWSETIGWVSLNCENTFSCGTTDYRVEVNTAGVLSGYAWSEHSGWISANQSDVAGCPAGGTCTARINPSNGNFLGWMKALASSDSESGGWDGWISLSCLNSGVCGTSLYGPILSFATDAISGFAWGDMVTGWIDFQYASTNFEPLEPDTYSCLDEDTLRYVAPDYSITDTVCPFAAYGYGCLEQGGTAVCLTPPTPGPSGGNASNNLRALPKLVHVGGTSVISWNIEDATSCTVNGDNGDAWTGLSGSNTSTPITERTTYTLYCESGIPGFDYTATATVNIAPSWQEI